jgi:hypothetical protein
MNQETLQLTGGAGKTKRRELDFYPTPPEVTHVLMQFLLKLGYGKNTSAWEPCCGTGEMSNVIKIYFDNVICTDISDQNKTDFLKTEITTYPEWIITNPPFDISEQIIRRALTQAPCVAMLLKSQYWHAKKRYGLFIESKPAYVLPLTWRPDFMNGAGGGAPTMEVAWTI